MKHPGLLLGKGSRHLTFWDFFESQNRGPGFGHGLKGSRHSQPSEPNHEQGFAAMHEEAREDDSISRTDNAAITLVMARNDSDTIFGHRLHQLVAVVSSDMLFGPFSEKVIVTMHK